MLRLAASFSGFVPGVRTAARAAGTCRGYVPLVRFAGLCCRSAPRAREADAWVGRRRRVHPERNYGTPGPVAPVEQAMLDVCASTFAELAAHHALKVTAPPRGDIAARHPAVRAGGTEMGGVTLG